MDNSFINRMAEGWGPKTKRNKKAIKSHEDDWNWFFKDSDKDGVMNGIDCQPYNRKKQDPPFLMSAPSSFKPISSSGMITSGPNQNVSMMPKQDYFNQNKSITITPTTSSQIISKQFQPNYSPSPLMPKLSSPQMSFTPTTSKQFNISSQSTLTASAPVQQTTKPLTIQQMPTQTNLSPQGLTAMKNIISQSSPTPTSSFASVNAPYFKTPTDTRSSSLPDLRTNEEKLQASRQELARELEASAIAGSVLMGPFILPALGAAATPTALGAVGMISGEGIGALHSVAQEGKVDVKDIAKNVAIGGAVGFAAGYVPAKIASLLSTQKPQFADYTINEQNKDLVPLLKNEKIRIPGKVETGVMEKLSGANSTNELGGWHLKPFNQTVIPRDNVTPEIVAHESIHGLIGKTKFSEQTVSNLAGQAVADDQLLAKTAPSPGFFEYFSGKQPGMLKEVVNMTGGYKGNAANEEIIARFVNLYPQEVAHPTTQTGAFLNQLFVNRGTLPVIQQTTAPGLLSKLNPSMIEIAQYGPTGKAAEVMARIPGGTYVNRLYTKAASVIGSMSPTEESVLNKLGTSAPSFEKIAGTTLTPAENVVIQNTLSQRLTRDVGMSAATAVGLGINKMMLNNPMELGSK